MKRNIIFIGISLFIGSLLLTSCDDWLDVRPKSEIPTDLHFERENGFKDQLTGVYTAMSQTTMYGRDMSFGLVSVLSQDYDLKPNSMYRYAGEYNYEETSTKGYIDQMWTRTYNQIANLNVLLQYIDEVDPNIFSDDNHDIYKGEALGLRAFLHLDMLRLYSPSPASNSQASGVPYVDSYGKGITGQKTVMETLDLIIADLLKAADLLQVDPFLLDEDYKVRYARRVYFNYYAVIGTLARAYLYKGDLAKALEYANIIIEEGEEENSNFAWTHYSSIEVSQEEQCNRIFRDETLFYLNIKDLDNIVKYYFTSSSGNNTLTPSDDKADQIFEKTSKGYGNDYRMLKGFSYDGDGKYFWKYHQYVGGAYNDVMPVIRKSESYYIAAEALKESNPARAIELLNIVRSYRNLKDFALENNLTPQQIQEEIGKEYRKEFLGEAQMFYYYKRLNAPRIEGAAVNTSDNVYVLPMPDNEIEFGNRK